jgi:hypothetical protein
MLAVSALSGCFIAAQAATQQNAPAAPPAVTQSLGAAQKKGQSRLVVLGFNIYDARLWATENFSVSDFSKHGFALELQYLRNFSGKMIAERSLKEMRRLGTVSDDKAKQWLSLMLQAFPDVKKGDQLIGVHQSDGSASFFLNGRRISEVRDDEFARLFFGIWLSPQTSEPKMRNDLIGASAASDGTRR